MSGVQVREDTDWLGNPSVWVEVGYDAAELTYDEARVLAEELLQIVDQEPPLTGIQADFSRPAGAAPTYLPTRAGLSAQKVSNQ